MINAGKLLADLKRLRKVLDGDLRTTHAAGAQRDAVQAEWREAFDLGRTRDTFEAFLDGAFDQALVHWVLGCVFLRFLEDNLLVDRPFLSGPGERLDLAKERQEAHFRALPHDSDTEYLLATFGEAARLPGMAGLFDPAHNPLFRLPLSGDGAMSLIRFFREVLPEAGELAHDFTDPHWNTRFLGDLYQNLSEEARKRYALLQTPDFVESWILDRTLEPAIREFDHERATMVDPACGSGHFLLGGFARLLRKWQRFAPGLPPAEHAQRALDAVAGVDLNPFAVEIARFRLLMAALRAAEVNRLAAAPGFVVHLAAGFVGLIVDNSFMKRQHGKKLIEQVLARLDVTHVVSCAGVPLPGHNTSTVILFGRNRAPVADVVRTVRNIKGDPEAVVDPGRGKLWNAILSQADQAKSEGAFITTEDTLRVMLAQHPWNMGNGGAAHVQKTI